MAKKHKVVPPLVLISWADHCSQDAWQDQEEAKREPLAEIRSVGWLINEDNEKYTLIADHDENYVQVSRTMVIGKGLVRAMKVLRKGKNNDNKTVQARRDSHRNSRADGGATPSDASGNSAS